MKLGTCFRNLLGIKYTEFYLDRQTEIETDTERHMDRQNSTDSEASERIKQVIN